METTGHAERAVHDLLEQHFPEQRYSREDRLSALLLLLHAQRMTVKLTDLLRDDFEHKREGLERHPVSAVHDVLHAKTGALRAESDQERADKLVRALFFTPKRPGREQPPEPYPELRIVFEDECRKVRSDAGQHVPIGSGDLDERGYRLTARQPHERSDPRHVTTFTDLVEALRALHITQGSPSLREMAKASQRGDQGEHANTGRGRSHATLGRVVMRGARPRHDSVLAFVHGCGVVGAASDHEWTQAHARAVMADREATSD